MNDRCLTNNSELHPPPACKPYSQTLKAWVYEPEGNGAGGGTGSRGKYGVFREVRQKRNINAFMNEYFLDDKAKFFDSYDIIRTDSINFLIVKMYARIDSTEIRECVEGLKKHRLENFKIEIIPTSEINPSKIRELEAKLISVEDVKNQFEEIKSGSKEKDLETQNLRMQLDSIMADTLPFAMLSKEAKTLFPDLQKSHHCR